MRLAAARVPVKHGFRIVEARGRRHLEAVLAARVNGRGGLIRGTEQVCSTDTLAVGHGFSPNIELPQQAGCAVSYDADKGGWFVDVDPSMNTSVPDIYAAGETTGIAGAGKSLIEGQLAAWDILLKMERVDRQRYETGIHPLARQRRREVRYGRFVNQLCRLSPECYADICDETIICRCEEITMGEIRRQLSQGFGTMNSLKKATRCGMGYCQARMCGPILFDIVSAFTKGSPAHVGSVSARAPVKSVSLGALAKMSTKNR